MQDDGRLTVGEAISIPVEAARVSLSTPASRASGACIDSNVQSNARCIREGRRLHPARQLPSHHAKHVDFERSHISKLSQSA
jgi:hypothetical protein